MLAEELRLKQSHERSANWQRWGPYLAERQWGTVREDYSATGECWDSFPHDHARSRAYRWGEDGLLGISDRECRLCFALALWNGKAHILKERLFGLTGPEGNHGEDVKECYFYLDSTPTHSYMKSLYKYPQAEFPYDQLVAENRRRGRHDAEFELADTGVFDQGRYFDVFAEYAKATANDILIRITIANRGDLASTIHVLPTLWFRNTWSWGCTHEGCELKPSITRPADGSLIADHPTLGRFRLHIDRVPGSDQTNISNPVMLMTENETNAERLYAASSADSLTKDAFHGYVISGQNRAVLELPRGTKAAAYFVVTIPVGGEITWKLRLAKEGLMFSKQFYYYDIQHWLKGDPDMPKPPESRLSGRNSEWTHLFNRDIISMPDKWEYPWYAAWDLAFHMIPMAMDYIALRGSGRTIIAGYPWFTDWGRDTFIALRGLCLATGQLEDAGRILTAWAEHVSEGMLPNRFPDQGDIPEYNAVDASLWYVIAAYDYLNASRISSSPRLNADRKILQIAVHQILLGYTQGTRFGIRAETDGLLSAGQQGVQLTWMDARCGDWVVTPRIGKPVEVQALWINALWIGSKFNADWEPLFLRARESFRDRFWNPSKQCLYDVVDVDHQSGQNDDSIRPNQIFAVGGLPLNLLNSIQSQLVLQIVEDRLLTPIGLRTLEPAHSDYHGTYGGGVRDRDAAYHQGTVWPWLKGPFVEAWLRVRGHSTANRRYALFHFVQPLLDHIRTAGLGHVSEIADGDSPHRPAGCPFQAWSVGELLRMQRMVAESAESAG